MVITSALHAEGREFDPRRNLYSLFFFQKTHFNWNLWSQRDWCYFFVRFLIRWQASQTTTFEMHENAPLVCWMMLQLIGTRRTTQCGQMSTCAIISMPTKASAHSSRLAQSVEHETLNLGVVGSSPTLGVFLFICWFAYGVVIISQEIFHSEYRSSYSVGGVKVSIVAFQAIDPGSIPGWRMF